MAQRSRISVGVLPTMTIPAKELALVAPLWEEAPFYHAGALRLGVTPVLREHDRKLPSNELGSGDAALPRRAREQPIIGRIERDRRRLLS